MTAQKQSLNLKRRQTQRDIPWQSVLKLPHKPEVIWSIKKENKEEKNKDKTWFIIIFTQ